MAEYAAYINTPQTAADMNSILDAVGQKDMIYWGFSYGCLLGQTYAGLYPSRARRVVIDGIVNQFEWYEGRFEVESFSDTDSVLGGFFDECMKAEDCALSALAASGDELRDVVLSFMEGLRVQPQGVYVNNTVHGILDYDAVWYNGVFPALYKPPMWYSLARNLYGLIRGNATDAFLAYGVGEERGDESNEFVVLNDGRTGSSRWPQDREALLALVAPWMNGTSFGIGSLVAYYQKQQWAVPRTHSYVPRRGVETAHPLLIMSTSYDPVCPLVSARSANEAFAGSRIVEVEGYGHCSVAVGSVCAARHLRAFLYEGVLPDANVRCKVDSDYFVKPDEKGQVARAYFEDVEDQKIHLAQLELMADLDFAGRMLW